MHKFVHFALARYRINRLVSPEVKRIATQALLGLKTVVGESLCKLLFRLILRELTGDVLTNLLNYFTS